jgi:aromatic-L-amino-acid decarboxylase
MHVELAQKFSSWIEEDPDFELSAPVPLNLVCFRHKEGDEFNRQLLDSLITSGEIYLTHTSLNDRYTIRICIGQTQTEERHVENAWKLIREHAANLQEH